MADEESDTSSRTMLFCVASLDVGTIFVVGVSRYGGRDVEVCYTGPVRGSTYMLAHDHSSRPPIRDNHIVVVDIRLLWLSF